MNDEEFDKQMNLLRTKGLEILKETGPYKIEMPDGSIVKVEYEAMKKELDEMAALVALSRKIQSH